jgi:hypothetical protein
MKTSVKLIASMICMVPIVAAAQAPAPTSTDKAGSPPPAGMQNKQSTDTGQSTTYPKSDATSSMKKSGTATDKEKDKITKGDATSQSSPTKSLDEPVTSQKPAKEGSQSGPTK